MLGGWIGGVSPGCKGAGGAGGWCLLWGAEDSVCISGRGWDSEAGENTPKIIRILFSLVHLDGEVLSVLPCLCCTFRGPFSARKDLCALRVALLSFPEMENLKVSFNRAGSCPVWSYSSVNKGFVMVWKGLCFFMMKRMCFGHESTNTEQVGWAVWMCCCFFSCSEDTGTCLALGRCSVSWGRAVVP